MSQVFYFYVFTICYLITQHSNAFADQIQNFNLKYKHAPNQLILNLSQGAIKNQNTTQFLKQIKGIQKIEQISSSAYLIHLSPSQASKISLTQQAIKIESLPEVQSVEANMLLTITDLQPNDPKFDQQWGHHSILSPQIWDEFRGTKEALIAVIDTGIDHTHEDLADNIWFNQGETGIDEEGNPRQSNGVDDDQNGFIDDWRGWDFVNDDNDPFDDHRHGTHCAGIIGAAGNNSIGVTGVNWTTNLVGIKFLDETGSGTLANAVKSIEYATILGVHVTNNSWGGGGFSQTMLDSIQRAHIQNILFVAAAGNNGTDNDKIFHYPSGYQVENIIGVAAIDQQDQLADFSQYGKKTVHIAAPGYEIISTTPDSSYQILSGTSMATPFVSGAIGILKNKYPEKTPQQLKEKLLASVDAPNSLSNRLISGGKLNLQNALEEDDIPPSKVTAIEVLKTGLSKLWVSFSPVGDDGLTGDKVRYEFRVSEEPVKTIQDWENSSSIPIITDPQNPMIYLLSIQDNPAKGYLSIRARDNVGNWSELSDPAPYQLGTPELLYKLVGNHLEGIKKDPKWGTEEFDGQELSVISDSPGGDYDLDVNSSLYLPSIIHTSKDLMMTFGIFHQIEFRFDSLYIEVSNDEGETWKSIEMITGDSKDWVHKKVLLNPWGSLNQEPEVYKTLIRFRFASDYSVAKDGVYLKNIQVFGPKVT